MILYKETEIGTIPEDWEIEELQHVSKIIDSMHQTPEYSSEGIPMVRSTDIKSGNLSLKKTLRVTNDVYEEFTQNHKPQRNDIVMSRVGTYFVTSFVDEDTPFCLGQNTVVIHPSINSRFVYYSLNSSRVKKQIEEKLVGSGGQRTISLENIRRLLIPKPVQRVEIERIAETLSNLDAKIVLNNQVNQTLEEMGLALFKHWFVDFEFPDEKGQPYKSSGGEMVDSELGEIPKGWGIGCLGDIAKNERDVIRPSEMSPEVHYIALEHMPQGSIALDSWGNAEDLQSNKYKFKEGDFLFGKLRPYFHKVGVAPIDGICSTDILVVVPIQQEWYGCTLEVISSEAFIAHVSASSTGTKMPRTDWNVMSKYPIVLPPKELAQLFTQTIKPTHELIKSNILHSNQLASIRDSLLPKLMSGEVRVPVGA